MFFVIGLYFTTLFIAPQLWVEPFIGLRTDYIFFPIWIIYAAIKPTKFNIIPQDVFLVLLYVWIIVGVAVNGENHKTVLNLVNYTRFLLIYFLVRKTVVTYDDVKLVVKLIIVFVGVLVIEGIQHKHSVDGLGWAGQKLGWVDRSVIEAGGSGRTRWINIFDGPGVFCVVYTLALPFLLRYLDKFYSSRVKVFALLGIIPLLLATYYTGSRGGFLATLAMIALYIAIRSRVSFSRIASIGGVLMVIFMLAPSHLTQIKDENRSAQQRVDLWMEGVEMLQQNPVFGIGRGNFDVYTGRIVAHNSSIEIMGELGFVGLFFWSAFIYLAIKSVFVIHKSTTDAHVLSLNQGIGIAIVGMLVSSMFVTLEYETFYFLMALPAVLAVALGQKVSFTRKDAKYLVLGLLSWILVLKIFISLYY